MSTIVIDPGHGGTAPVGGSSANNATGPDGTLERDLTLDISGRVRDALADHQVILTRSTDVNLSLADRAKVACDAAAAVFVSIHFNGFSDPAVQGTETWVHTNGTDEDQLLAESVLQRLVTATGRRDRGVRRKDLGVLDPNRHDPVTAACLAELSFLTDPEEERRIADAAYRNRLADAVARGISDYVARQSTGS